MNLPETAAAKACCADLYQSDLARLVLGDTRHPGGLRLTNRLGRLMSLQRDDWVVDLASGNGTGSAAISRAFHCNVVGIEFGRAATLEARTRESAGPVRSRAYFVQGDAEQPPLRSGRFDGVLSECSLSLFPDKAAAVQEALRLLRPGGRLGISDVTVTPGSLPPELGDSLGQMLCLTDALGVDGYAQLLQDGGLNLLHQEDASVEVLGLLDDLEAKLGALALWQSFSVSGETAEEPSESVGDWPGLLLAQVRNLVTTERLGYWLYVGQKPG